MTALKLTLTALATGLLVACSSAPGEGDIQAALVKATSQSNKALGPLLGNAVKMEVLGVKKIGCKEEGNAHLCDFEMRTKAPIVGEQVTTTRGRFVKGSDGWVMSM